MSGQVAASAASSGTEFYEALLNSMSEGVSLSTQDGHIIYTNPAEDRMFGYSAGELVGQHVSVQNAYPEEENQRRVSEVIEQLEQQGSWEGEWLNRRKDGSEFVTASRITAVEVGGATHWLCVQRDISAARKVQQALVESEERFRLAAGAARIGTWDLDIATSEGRWDDVAVEIGGQPRHAYTIEDWTRLIHPDDRAPVDEQFRASLLPGGPVYAAEFRASAPAEDGGVRWLASNGIVLRSPEGVPMRAVGIVRDITEQKRAEERLRSSETKFRLMADSAPTLIWVNGADGGCEFVNEEYLRFFGKSLEDVLGFGWLPSAHPEDGEAYIGSYLEAVRLRTRFEASARFQAADGSFRWLHSVAQPRLADDGSYLGHVGVSSDVTEQKLADERQAMLVQELNHRVKNTLAVVQSIAHQSLRTAPGADEMVQAFEGRLLALAAAHRLLTERSWADASLADVVQAALAPYDLTAISIDGEHLHVPPQTAVNLSLTINELATNATKYGALSVPGGRVSVRWTLSGPDFSFVWQERGGPEVRPATRKGFGTRMIERVLASEMKAAVQMQFDPEGLTCRIEGRIIAPKRPAISIEPMRTAGG